MWKIFRKRPPVVQTSGWRFGWADAFQENGPGWAHRFAEHCVPGSDRVPIRASSLKAAGKPENVSGSKKVRVKTAQSAGGKVRNAGRMARVRNGVTAWNGSFPGQSAYCVKGGSWSVRLPVVRRVLPVRRLGDPVHPGGAKGRKRKAKVRKCSIFSAVSFWAPSDRIQGSETSSIQKNSN